MSEVFRLEAGAFGLVSEVFGYEAGTFGLEAGVFSIETGTSGLETGLFFISSHKEELCLPYQNPIAGSMNGKKHSWPIWKLTLRQSKSPLKRSQR
ncbi:MAG: hypothetical protein LBD55_04245 [Treponema sp.]|jgi:hypothetical protein|nr:hypothetical protein [Treponema sp.]